MKAPANLQRVDDVVEPADDLKDLYAASTVTNSAATSNERRRNAGPNSIECICLADVEPEAVTWIWPGYLPVGKLVILDGDPGVGKSTITMDMAARVSTGSPFPGDYIARPPAGVLLVSVEDGLADTVRPRLDACGADISRIHAPKPGEYPVLPDAVDWLRCFIIEHSVALVVIDPIMAFLNSKNDAHKDQDVRQILGKLSAVAEDTGGNNSLCAPPKQEQRWQGDISRGR